MFWLEAIKTLASVATPIVVFSFGILLLRRIERVKADVAKQSDFDKKWAEQFFDCCQEFLSLFERKLAVLLMLADIDTKYHNEEFQKMAQMTANEETLALNTSIAELKFRIERSLIFAPTKGPEAMDAAKKCIQEFLDLIDKLSSETGGNPRKFIDKMNEFNKAAREAHAEILGVK